MNNDNKRDNNGIEEVVAKALAIGAGAALLYRGGGYKALSSGVKRASYALNETLNTASKTALKDMNAEFVSNVVSGFKRAFAEADDKITLRTNRPESILNAFTEVYQMTQNKPARLYKMYDDNMSYSLKSEFQQRFGNNDSELLRRSENVVDDFFSHINNSVSYDNGSYQFDPDFLEKHFGSNAFNEQQQEEMLQMLRDAMERRKSEAKEFATSNVDLIDEIISKFDLEGYTDKYGMRGSETNTQKFYDRLLGDQAATLNDLLENRDKIAEAKVSALKDGIVESEDVLDIIARFVEQTPEAGNLFVDPKVLRINAQGELYSFAETAKLKNDFLDEFAQTLPGKLFKTRDYLGIKEAPIYHYIGPGKADPILASAAERHNSTLLNNGYVRVLNKSYRVLEDNTLEHLPELDDLYLISGDHGTMNRLLKGITGDIDRKPESKNPIFRFLGISTSTDPNKFKKPISFFSKFNDPRWGRNVAGSFLETDENELVSAVRKFHDSASQEESREAEEYIGKYFNRVKRLDKVFNQTTRQLDRSTINKLFDAISDDSPSNAKSMLRMLTMKDEDMIKELMNHNPNSFNNGELTSLVKRHLKDADSAERAMSLVSDNKGVAGSTRAVKFTEMIRKELAKEAFLSYRNSVGGSNASLLRLFDIAGIEGKSLKETRYLANWAIFQDASKHHSNAGIKSIEEMANRSLDVLSLFSAREGSDDVEFVNAFRNNVETMVKEKVSVMQRGFQREQDIIPGHSLGKYTSMRKAVSIIDVLNDQTKATAFLKQFVAGRNDMQNVTTATMFPYFMLHRLTEGVSSLGLKLSPKDTGSVGSLAANIMLKRVLPVAGALTALSYLDYEAENFTGTSLRGAVANTWANIDLTNRRISDSLGFTDKRKEKYELNPMRQYLNNNQPYQSYEERKEWYENGYSPVRKSRWWSFGSDSEYRGGKIDYFEPNYLRQAHSNWRDIGIYGSPEEKWKHSWVPTPRHPLAPLRALADPYWLERKNYWDRPYPVTGKMFGEGTPWGAILNPTVGEIIKPMRRMHQDELGNTLVDVRTLIARRNQEIISKANNNSNLVKVDGSGAFTPVSYTALGAPTQSENVLTLNVSNGNVSNAYVAGMDYQAMSLADHEPVHDALQSRAVAAASGESYSVDVDPNLPVADRIQLNADRGGIAAGIVKNIIPLDMISSVNRSIKSRAMIAPEGGKEGIITADAIFKTSGKDKSFLSNDDFNSDLRNITSTKDFLRDAGYSAKELAGMYGFLYEEMFPPRKSARLQSADRMASFSRKFWDASIGGLGGEFMEIARRFVPHEDHSVNRINPIKNTMPDWMPEKFQYGDPYEQLPKGEMRLPGKGYEDINTLHPDQYGRYGAFDRMKILADIAPWSGEYRTWREIATKTVQDPHLKAEMDKIKDRVNQQSKQHDFYPYRFRGTKLADASGVVETVSGNSFTLVGSDTKYRIAGVKFKEGTAKDYLAPGTSVRLRFGENEAHQKTINAIVFVQGENLNKQLLDSGKAEKSKDESVAGIQARFTQSQIDRGKLNELIAHAPIPLIHRKFLRINTPLESWKEDNIYGTSYATWSHPIQGFVIPEFQRAFNISHAHAALGMASWLISEKVNKAGAGNVTKGIANAAFALTNPGAFAGGVGGFILKLNSDYVRTGARIGATVGLLGYAYTNADNPIFSTTAGAIAGREIAEQFWKGTGSKGALIGAAAGFALTATKNPSLDPEKMWGPWIPKKVKDKWEIEEYYDRLKYIKYMGLYEKAARAAKSKENVDIKRLINKYEYDSEKREKIKKQLLANKNLISNTYAEGSSKRDSMLADIDAKLEALSYPEQVLKAGKYTKAAIAYKQAAESTVYGLKENATWSQILRAVPKYERDYVLEFGKETDPKRRKEILRYISPYRRRVLQSLWGEEQDKVKSNKEFFTNHQLPGMFWAGWQPDVDLDKVEIKTIKNEGMLLSDFGFYESEAETEEAMMAPEVDFDKGTSALELRKNLITSLSGAGLIGVDVSIEPSSQPGIQMIADIARINTYQIKQKINSFTGRIFY